MSPSERKAMIRNRDLHRSEPDEAVQFAEDQPVVAVLHAGWHERGDAETDE